MSSKKADKEPILSQKKSYLKSEMNLKLPIYLILLQLTPPQIYGKFKANPPSQKGLIWTSVSRPKQLGVGFLIKGKNDMSFPRVQGS